MKRRSAMLALLALAAGARAGAANDYLARSDVQQFVDALVAEHAFDRHRVERWLRDARYSATVERLMQPPIPFGQRNWPDYRKRYLEPSRIQAGVVFWQTH